MDGYTNEVIPNCSVKVSTKGGELIVPGEDTSSENLYNTSEKNLRIEVENMGDRFIERTVHFFNKKRLDTVFVVYLYPNSNYEMEMLAIEDQTYGTRDSIELSDLVTSDNEVWQEASFPGGAIGMQKFIVHTTIYPRECIDLDVQGKIYLEFVVEPDGKITHAKVVRGLGNLLDNEAIRTVRAMPIWEPAKDADGKQVRSLCRLPIVYTLK